MKFNVFATIVSLFLFSSLKAQVKRPINGWTYIQIDSTKQMWGDWNEPEWLRYFGLDAGDVNQDGNMDIVSGRYVYHNPGGSMEGSWERTVLDDNVDAILFMDVDGDPFADIIAMALPNLYWYESTNTEGTQYRRKLIGQVPATSHVNSQGFEKAQIIAGGLSEFVIAGNGDIYAVQIPTEEVETRDWKVKMICKDTSDEGIGIGDIDGDGDLDIAAGRRPNGEEEPKILVWFENPGHIDAVWEPTVVGQSKHPIDRVAVADVNGDQKADIIVTEERYPGLEPDANFWWFGQKSLNDWERNQIVEQYSINNLDITDIDGDGDTDLLTAEHKGKVLELQLWKNDGLGNFTKTVLDTGKENHLGTQFFDLDNDGDLDIIGAGWDQHQFMHVWRNDAIKTLKTGMIFKDHPWVPTMVGDSGKFLRVGGKLDYSINNDHFPKRGHRKGYIPLNQNISLKNAIAAEVFVERVQSHEDTKDLRIQFNNGKEIHLEEPATIPDPATDYMFHSNIRATVPLSNLIDGNQNSFKLTVAKEQSWDWPQNLVYGVVLRVYYDSSEKKSPIVNISGLRTGDQLGNKVTLSLEGEDIKDVFKVDYIGLYEDVNVQGDGKYLQWQFRYHRGKIRNHIGSSTASPFNIEWNTAWVPDQPRPMKIMALVTDDEGYTFTTESIEGLSIERKHAVRLIKPYEQPPFWTTRSDEHVQSLPIPFEISKDDIAMLYWNSWSPCYSVGLSINGKKQEPLASVPCYDAHWHEEKLMDIHNLKQGTNELKTLKTPLHDGQMVHGMDVQWPGIMLKIKQENPRSSKVTITQSTYENRPHYVVTTNAATYYYDIAGGGFSRIIDTKGNDWINYRTEPWNQYPASAASAYRGLPNLVFGSEEGGAGHPGHDQCTSKIVAPNKIQTVSKSGLWEWEWTFYDTYAILDVLKTKPNSSYWFLYEGTPGGKYDPLNSIYGTNISGPNSDTPDFYKGSVVWNQFQWGYFTHQKVDNSFYIAQITTDKNMDMMSYLGDSEAGTASKNGMTVFGFGRNQNTEALLKGKNRFLIGMWPRNINKEVEHQKFSEHIDHLIQKYQNNEK